MLKFIIEGLLIEIQSDNINGLSGYDINQSINDYPAFKSGFGNIYPALKKLEAAGSIKSREIVEAGKYKKIYTINEKGKKEFLEWLEQPIKLTKSQYDHLIRLYFYQYLPKAKVKILISDFIKRTTVAKRSLEIYLPLVKKNINYYQEACLQYSIDSLQFLCGWYQKFLKSLDDKK